MRNTSCLGREIEFVVKPQRFKGTQCLYPEVFSAEEGVAYLLFGHCLVVLNLFDHDDPKIPVEGVASTAEMLVYLYGVWTLYIVPMFVNSPVCLLSLQFSYILLLIITAVTP